MRNIKNTNRGMTWPKTDPTHYHAHLSEIYRAIKGLIVFSIKSYTINLKLKLLTMHLFRIIARAVLTGISFAVSMFLFIMFLANSQGDYFTSDIGMLLKLSSTLLVHSCFLFSIYNSLFLTFVPFLKSSCTQSQY